MWKFLNWRRRSNSAGQGAAARAGVPEFPGGMNNLAKLRELLPVVLRDTLKKNGIPNDWVVSELVVLSGDAQGEQRLIQLVILHWHEQLMRYAPSLQEQLWQGLARFEPDLDPGQFSFGWKFGRDCGYPVLAMPDPSIWLSAGFSAELTQPLMAKKFDLPASEYDHRSSGFAPTQPGELR